MIAPIVPEMVDPVRTHLDMLELEAAQAVGQNARQFVALRGGESVSSEASIRWAAASAIAAGGGTVLIVGDETTPISIAAPLPVASGLTYRGSKRTSWVEMTSFLSSGTTLVGDGVASVSPGTFNCFEFNVVDSPALPYLNTTDLWRDTIRGFGLHDLILRSFSTAVRFGALHRNGVHTPVINNVVAEHCSIGFWLENCMQPEIGHVYYGQCKKWGFVLISSMESLWHHGNGIVEHIYGQNSGGMCDRHTRGIWIGARGTSTEFNNILVLNLQHNGMNSASYTQNSSPIFNANDPNILVTSNISNFQVGEIVWFGSAVGGFDPNNLYWILSRVDNGDGTGTIQVGNSEGTLIVNTPSASGSSSMSVSGGTSILIGGIGDANFLTNSRFNFIDSEASSGAAIVFQRSDGTYVETSIISGGAGYLSFVATRLNTTCGAMHRRPLSNAWVNTNGLQFSGLLYSSHFGGSNALKNRAQGLLSDGTVERIFLSSTRRSIGNRAASLGHIYGNDPSGYDTVGLGAALVQQHSRLASGTTIAYTDGGLITYTGASGGSLTLPAITANMIGLQLEISNPASGSITINTSSSQTINGAAGVTSFTLDANTLGQFRACTTDGTTFFWAAK